MKNDGKKNFKSPYNISVKCGLYRKYFKRSIDLISSIVGLIVLSPVLLFLALLIRVKLGNPVIFKQERPGLNEEIFTLYKFRTMTDERDEQGNLLPDEIRLTKFGIFLRSTSLDELPELWNIAKGDMSFIGPRPLRVQYLPYFNEYEKHRHDVRPGLSGLAQIKGRNTILWEDTFRYDINYIENISFKNDVKLIFLTLLKVIKREGIEVGETGHSEDFDIYRKKSQSHPAKRI